MAKPVRITNLQGKPQDITPGKGYPATSPADGKRGYIVYDDKGEGKFTAYPTQPAAKPKPVKITNLQGKAQDVTPGKGYPTTSPAGKRGYIVYDNKGVGKFTAYPDKPSPTPAPAQPSPAPTSGSGGGGGGGGGGRSTTAPDPASTTTASATPQASPVAKYMAAASAARKSGDPAQMAAVRDQGLAIWRDKYKDTLAKKVSPTGQQLGTGQSVMAKQAAELRALRPVKTPEAPVSTSATTTAAPAPQPTVKTDTASQRVQAAQKPIPPTVKPIDTKKLENSNVKKTSTGILAASYEYDAYDLVLEYLLSEGHADTIEEAHYVMLQMDAEHIQNIVESPGEWFRGIFNPNNSVAFKAQNTSPFNRPVTPLPKL